MPSAPGFPSSARPSSRPPPLRSRAGSVLAALLGLFVLGICLPASAPAQEAGGGEPDIDTPYRWIDRGFRVGLVGGYVATGTGVLDMGPRSSPVISLGARTRITSPISLEAKLSFGDSERAVVDPRLSGGPTVVDTVPVRWAMLEGGLQLALTGARTWHGLQPFVSLGAGLLVGVDEPASTALGLPSDTAAADFRFELNTAPVATAAAGAEWLLSDRLGVSFQARDHMWRLTTPEGFFRPEILDRIEASGTAAPTERDWVHNLELSVGIWYYP